MESRLFVYERGPPFHAPFQEEHVTGKLLARLLKESVQQSGTAGSGNAPHMPYPVIQEGQVQPVETGGNRPGLVVRRPIDDAGKPRMDNGAGAHEAWFERDHQNAAVQPIVAHSKGCGAKSEHFRMGRRVMTRDGLIVPGAYEVALRIDDNGSYRHFTVRPCFFRLSECFFHEPFPCPMGRRRRNRSP